MPLINCKIKLNLTWKKECVLSTDAGNAVFIVNDTKMYVPVVTLSKEDNKDFIEQQNKGFQRSIYWNEYKTKEINENDDANVFKYINLDPSFQAVNRLFVMAYNRENGQPTRNGQRKYYLRRISLNKYNVIIDGRNFYDNPIESDIEKYRELKKVMIGKGEDYTTGSLLDFYYFKKRYKLVAVDLSKQKELDADPRAIQQIEFKYMLEANSTIYWILEKTKETILEFYKGTVKSNEGLTLRLSTKNFNKDEVPHELLLTTRQNTKLRNALNNNSATDIKLSKAQIKKLIQIKYIFSGIKLIIEEEDMKDIIKIIKELENSDILLKEVSKTIENEIKEQRGGFLSMLLGTLGASLLGNLLTGKSIIRAGDGIVRAGEESKKKTKFAISFPSINKYKNK